MTSKPFLKEIAGILLESGKFDILSTSVVFPNKRARLYFSKYMGELTDKPVWAPRYFTISELMEKFSGSFYADRLTLLFELFDAYTKVTGSGESFDTFYPYSETLLADFDEIDKYLVNAHDLFRNLSDLKSLDGRFNYLSEDQLAFIRRFWSTFDPERPSEGQSGFVSLWESLSGIYDEFKDRLKDKNLAYEGMAYRSAVENLNTQHSDFGAGKYLIVGFNALNTCEERLFRYLKNNNQAEFYWDYDSWYTNNEIHEAGYFMRRNLKNFPQVVSFEHDNLTRSAKNILFIPVASNSRQTAVLPQVLERMAIRKPEAIENTALVLADEGLLIPALYALPGFIKEVNVTMGYPLAGSAVFSLVDSLYSLNRNSGKGNDGKPRWRFTDVLAVISNPMLKKLYGCRVEVLKEAALNRHMMYMGPDDIIENQSEDFVFNNALHEDACSYLVEVFTGIIRLQASGEEKTGMADPLQVELLFQVYIFLIRLQDILRGRDIFPGTELIFRLIRNMMRKMHVPFSGEPLAGMQILGLLETRTLDFDNVILLSANEGVLPKPADKPSFIPYSLRAGFGLPTPEHHDAIYAYYFYRLIQRATNIALVYDSSSGGMRTGERSRFLHQLYYEMQLPVTEVSLASSISTIPVKSITIEKSGTTKDILDEYYGEGSRILSPSAINEFFNCSLRFYFHHIAGLPQPEEITDEIDARMFGTLLHHALKTIYTRFGKEIITREKLEAVLKDEKFIHDALDKAFREEFFGDKTGTDDRIPEGFNLIVKQVIFAYIKQLISAELNLCPFSITHLEEKFVVALPVTIQGKTTMLRVGGIVDRIDSKEGKTRIIDYKTGTVKDRFDSVTSLFESGEKLRNDAVFQVLLYSYIYSRIHPDENIFPGLYFIRESHADNFTGSIKMGPKKESIENFSGIEEEFEALLKEGMEKLFNIDEPFLQTINLDVCSYCPYSNICRREKEI